MQTSSIQRVHDLLYEMQRTPGLDPLKRLFWTELNYDRANQSLSTRNWPDAAVAGLADDPVLFATAGGEMGGFSVITCRLSGNLLIAPQRPVIDQLLKEFPYALYIFSDEGQQYWHFVNVKYDKEARSRRLFRRITVGPYERLRTASERIAMLDLATIDHDLFGVSPLAIQQRHDEAFDVEAVTRTFFQTYREVFEAAEDAIQGIDDAERCRLFTQRLFNRLMFIVFLERKGWLEFNGEYEYLDALWADHQREIAGGADENFYRDRLKLLFFSGLNTRSDVNIIGIAHNGPLQARIGSMPYLNGGLFEEDEDDQNLDIWVPDEVIGRAIDRLFYHYNFTITESTPLDVEVAVDPEMLGKIFEELVTGRHESGSYYTPKPVVSFMGREALKGTLGTACPDEAAEAIEQFVDHQNPEKLANPEQILEALKNVTICDPACGSGAYLLGMLQELLALRNNLFRGDRKLDNITGYQRKLEIIENNLYGVDIDPFAVNIARLRLWLSLIVDFEGKNPPPLPNLDFKIEVGDSITGPDPSIGSQTDITRYLHIDRFNDLKAQYLMSHGGEKVTLKKEIERLRQEIATWAQQVGEQGFDWAVDFAEVFSRSQEGEAGGFDIVITNPPYVRQELIRDLKPTLKHVYGDLFAGTADLYVYFYYRALQMLRPDGVLVFISSNKWLRAGYGERLREQLGRHAAVETIVDFGDLPVFAATAYPCIVVAHNQHPAEDHSLRVLTVQDIRVVERIAEEVQETAWAQPQASLRPDGWALVQPDVLALMEKLRQSGRPLGEYAQGKLYYGIKTGLNEAFVINDATRARLIAEDPRSEEVIKPWLRGRDIDRWSTDWADLYIIALQNSGDSEARHPWADVSSEDRARQIFITTYQSIYNHLSQFEEALRKRQDQGRFWWELRACAYYAEFDKPKIIWRDIASGPTFAYDETRSLVDTTVFFVPVSDRYLLGLLNSSTVGFFFAQISPTVRGDYLRFKNVYMQNIPIPVITSAQQEKVNITVQHLLDLRGQGPEAAKLEAELNALVYQVYGLRDEEIALIENDLRAGESQ